VIVNVLWCQDQHHIKNMITISSTRLLIILYTFWTNGRFSFLFQNTLWFVLILLVKDQKNFFAFCWSVKVKKTICFHSKLASRLVICNCFQKNYVGKEAHFYLFIVVGTRKKFLPLADFFCLVCMLLREKKENLRRVCLLRTLFGGI